MYCELQRKAKEYIVTSLNQLSINWRFDIDTKNENYPVILGYGPNNTTFRAPIEVFHNYVSPDLIAGMRILCNMDYNITTWGGCFMVRQWFRDILQIYRINVGDIDRWLITFEIMSKDKTKNITSYVHGNIHSYTLPVCFISPFLDNEFSKFSTKEEPVSPLLLLLDPIRYFRRYSIIMHKYPELNRSHTFGIYELLVGYFPDVNRYDIEKCWVIQNIFWELSTDIGILIIRRVIDY